MAWSSPSVSVSLSLPLRLCMQVKIRGSPSWTVFFGPGKSVFLEPRFDKLLCLNPAAAKCQECPPLYDRQLSLIYSHFSSKTTTENCPLHEKRKHHTGLLVRSASLLVERRCVAGIFGVHNTCALKKGCCKRPPASG